MFGSPRVVQQGLAMKATLRHIMVNYSTWLTYTLLPVSMTLTLLWGCGSGSMTSISTAETAQVGEAGVFAVTGPSVSAAGLLRIDIASAEDLPAVLEVQKATFQALEPEIVPGFISYVAEKNSAFMPLAAISHLTLPGASQATIQFATPATSDVSLIFLGDPTEVTFDDFVIVRAVADLPADLRTPEVIATRASELYATRPAGPYQASDFDPIPDSVNTNYVIPGSFPAPDLLDALVVYAASFLPADLRTAANIISVATTLAPDITLTEADLAAIPGATLPGGVLVEPTVTDISAGSFQISIQADTVVDDSFTIGPATFIQITPVFPGFTTYIADNNSALLSVDLSRIDDLEGVTAETCIIAHQPGQDPSSPFNQLARASGCTEGGPVGSIRFAQFNASLNRSAAGQLVSDLTTPDSPQPQIIAEIIQRVNPDVVLINEFDYDDAEVAAELFRDHYLAVSQNGVPGVVYPFIYVAPSNTGIDSGFDFDNNGQTGDPGDAFGFGFFPGQFGMVLYSKFPIDEANVRTFQNFLWADMPGALLPDDPTTPDPADFYSAAELEVFRLSSKSHWDIPINFHGRTIHALASHPTPPVFDPPEIDFNGRRNNDEIRFWADYVVPGAGDYIYDDNEFAAAGNTTPTTPSGGLNPSASFVIMGDQNSDPNDGDSVPGAIDQILLLDQVNTTITPSSLGGPDAAARQGGANSTHLSDPAFDTADFNDDPAPGNLRADYVVPSSDLTILEAEVFWPLPGDPLFDIVGDFDPNLDRDLFPSGFISSDHRLIWIDLE